MQEINVDSLNFRFPDGWLVAKVDDWAFYRNQFIKVKSGLKSVDLLALQSPGILWFIEAKDYRRHQRQKTLSLIDEFASKVVSTLAMLLPASANASVAAEQSSAHNFLGVRRLRVAFHIEQPHKHSKLFPRPVEPANLKQEIRRRLKAVDPHPMVTGPGNTNSPAWEAF